MIKEENNEEEEGEETEELKCDEAAPEEPQPIDVDLLILMMLS